MPMMPANDLELCYDAFGDPDGQPLLLVMGLGSSSSGPSGSAPSSPTGASSVVRFDNRDVRAVHQDRGRPRRPSEPRALSRASGAEAPYLLTDMAADAVGLLDGLGRLGARRRARRWAG